MYKGCGSLLVVIIGKRHIGVIRRFSALIFIILYVPIFGKIVLARI